MEELIPLVAIISIFVVLPAMILHYVARMRETRSRENDTDRLAGEDLERLAVQMEQRIDSLERILDAEAPGWRHRHHG